MGTGTFSRFVFLFQTVFASIAYFGLFSTTSLDFAGRLFFGSSFTLICFLILFSQMQADFHVEKQFNLMRVGFQSVQEQRDYDELLGEYAERERIRSIAGGASGYIFAIVGPFVLWILLGWGLHKLVFFRT